MVHIDDFAVDLFHDTEIEFESIYVNEEFRNYFLPMDYARNIMMICKEALTNTLKHSQASKAAIDAELIESNKIKLTIADNGKGFNADTTEYGNGLHNIKKGSDYLKAHMEMNRDEYTGTRIFLMIEIPNRSNGKL